MKKKKKNHLGVLLHEGEYNSGQEVKKEKTLGISCRIVMPCKMWQQQRDGMLCAKRRRKEKQ